MAAVKRAATTVNKRDLLELSDDELSSLARHIGILPKLVVLSKRFHALFAPTLQTLRPLAGAPFRIPFRKMDTCESLLRSSEGITGDDLVTLLRAVSKGALASLEMLLLDSNKVGDVGLSALADAVSTGGRCLSVTCWGTRVL